MINLIFTVIQDYFLEKSRKFNISAQNSFFYVKIGLWILTTNFKNTTFILITAIIKYI